MEGWPSRVREMARTTQPPRDRPNAVEVIVSTHFSLSPSSSNPGTHSTYESKASCRYKSDSIRCVSTLPSHCCSAVAVAVAAAACQ